MTKPNAEVIPLTVAEAARADLDRVAQARERLTRTIGGQVPNELPAMTDYDRRLIGGPVRITLYPTSAVNLREQLDAVIGELQKAREATYPQPRAHEANLLVQARWHIGIAARTAKDIAAKLIKIDKRV